MASIFGGNGANLVGFGESDESGTGDFDLFLLGAVGDEGADLTPSCKENALYYKAVYKHNGNSLHSNRMIQLILG